MNNEQPKLVGAGISVNKEYRKSNAASDSSCVFLERDPCLRRATVVVTEVGQVKQKVTIDYKNNRFPIVHLFMGKKYNNSSCIFLERDPCLRRATVVVTEVGQVKQKVIIDYKNNRFPIVRLFMGKKYKIFALLGCYAE